MFRSIYIKNMTTMSFTMFKYVKTNHIPLLNLKKVGRYFSILQNINTEKTTLLKPEDNEIDLNDEVVDYQYTSVLSKTDEDLSHFGKGLGPTFNFAPYVNKSEALQNLVKLGVDLHKIEKKLIVEDLLKLDFEKDMKKHLTFLSKYMEPDNFGFFLTKNPKIFTQSIEDMETRINYLVSKQFTAPMIQSVVSRNPYWLMFSTLRIDKRLGFFQKLFNLKGSEVRFLTAKQPRLITYNLEHVNINTFAIKEEMGFGPEEIHKLLMSVPRLWMINQLSLIRRFKYAHETMKISHEMICEMPHILLCREFKIKQRHSLLEKLGRAQYNKTKANYVSIKQMVIGNDSDFCFNVAKCPVSDFNLYLKSM